LIKKQLPLSFITDGQRVPEDFHPARAHQMIQQAATLMESMQQDTMSDNYMAIAHGDARSHFNG
jgi:flagellar biosynthesis protein FlhF